jgi:hypothetical protein
VWVPSADAWGPWCVNQRRDRPSRREQPYLAADGAGLAWLHHHRRPPRRHQVPRHLHRGQYYHTATGTGTNTLLWRSVGTSITPPLALTRTPRSVVLHRHCHWHSHRGQYYCTANATATDTNTEVSSITLPLILTITPRSVLSHRHCHWHSHRGQ